MEKNNGGLFTDVSNTITRMFECCLPSEDYNNRPSSDDRIDIGAIKNRKLELEQLVELIAKRTQILSLCGWLDMLTGSISLAQYRLDSLLTTLTVLTEGIGIDIPLYQVKGVYGYEDIRTLDCCYHLRNMETITQLDESHKQCLIVVEYEEHGRHSHVALLEQEMETSDALITFLRVLAIDSNIAT